MRHAGVAPPPGAVQHTHTQSPDLAHRFWATPPVDRLRAPSRARRTETVPNRGRRRTRGVDPRAHRRHGGAEAAHRALRRHHLQKCGGQDRGRLPHRARLLPGAQRHRLRQPQRRRPQSGARQQPPARHPCRAHVGCVWWSAWGVCSHGEARSHDAWVVERGRWERPRLDDPSADGPLDDPSIGEERKTIRPSEAAKSPRCSDDRRVQFRPYLAQSQPSIGLSCWERRSLVGVGRRSVKFVQFDVDNPRVRFRRSWAAPRMVRSWIADAYAGSARVGPKFRAPPAPLGLRAGGPALVGQTPKRHAPPGIRRGARCARAGVTHCRRPWVGSACELQLTDALRPGAPVAIGSDLRPLRMRYDSTAPRTLTSVSRLPSGHAFDASAYACVRSLSCWHNGGGGASATLLNNRQSFRALDLGVTLAKNKRGASGNSLGTPRSCACRLANVQVYMHVRGRE